MGLDGRLTPVREESSSSLHWKARLQGPSAFSKSQRAEQAADVETTATPTTRSGPSNGEQHVCFCLWPQFDAKMEGQVLNSCLGNVKFLQAAALVF
jgi:hypothetical protein